MKDFIGEMLGTFVLTLFGCCSVAVAVLFGEYNSIFQIGLVWGIGVTLAIYMTRNICCAHLNPAVSVAMVVAGRMSAKKLPLYLLAQFAGAIFAGLVLLSLFSASIVQQVRPIMRKNGRVAQERVHGLMILMFFVSMRQRSVILRSGMTDKHMKAMVTKGECMEQPMARAIS